MRPLLLLLTLTCAQTARDAPADSASPAPDVRIDQHLGAQIPAELTFRDENGQIVSLKDVFQEKPAILVLGYYCCPRLCSLVSSGLADCLQRLDLTPGKDYRVVTVSIDPRETPEMAAAKKEALFAENRWLPDPSAWRFLTGEEANIQRLADSVGFNYVYDARLNQYRHGSGIIVVTPGGKVSHYFFGVDYPPKEVTAALRSAASGQIGAPTANPLSLLCFAYDPQTGKYTLATLRLVRIGSVVTIAVIAYFLLRRRRTTDCIRCELNGTNPRRPEVGG